jgi:hypothetical protein
MSKKLHRNDPCPCLGGEKYKKCCLGKVDWETIRKHNVDVRPYLSVRGRNIIFANRISEILQLNAPGGIQGLNQYKSAFTARTVREIYEATMEVWPPDTDIVNTLKRCSGDISGLYIGDYSPEYLTRAIVRHSIYAKKILLVDPFVYPARLRDEYNPIVNPEQHRAQTLKNVNLWLGLLPWVDAGLVEFIRPPSDFDGRLNWALMKAQEKKFAESRELEEASVESVDELRTRHTERLKHQQLLLGAPDSYLRHMFEKLDLGRDGSSVEDFLKAIQSEREQDPDFLEPMEAGSEGQLHMMSTGTSYLSAKLVADLTGSYLFTDLAVRWKEIELDRKSQNAENKVWAPFAKALQNASLKYLNNLQLQHALTLRKEGRLEALRAFLLKVWKAASSADSFDSANAVLLTEELGQRIRDAEQEWKAIDDELLKVSVPAAAGGLFAAGPLIAAGHAYFLATALATAGLAPLLNSTRKRRSFPDRYPAAFFMKIDQD